MIYRLDNLLRSHYVDVLSEGAKIHVPKARNERKKWGERASGLRSEWRVWVFIEQRAGPEKKSRDVQLKKAVVQTIHYQDHLLRHFRVYRLFPFLTSSFLHLFCHENSPCTVNYSIFDNQYIFPDSTGWMWGYWSISNWQSGRMGEGFL